MDFAIIMFLLLYIYFAYLGGLSIEKRDYKWASASYAFSLFWFILLILTLGVLLWER